MLNKMRGPRVTAIEVKTSRTGSLRALTRFQDEFPGARSLVVGPGGVALETFLSKPAAQWL